MVVIIDYGMGNVGSVKNALDYLKAQSLISAKESDLRNASHLILPGVGAFGEGMQRLKEKGLVEIIKREVKTNKKPFLGICLGMQMLADTGEEGGKFQGLGFLEGRTRRLKVNEKKFHLPHIGWNDVEPKKQSVLFREVASPVFYFVHSYVLDPQDKSIIEATCDYGQRFCAAIAKDNIFGVQFHPERSQKSGLSLLQNFLNI